MITIQPLKPCLTCGSLYGTCGHPGAPKPALKPCLTCGSLYGTCGH